MSFYNNWGGGVLCAAVGSVLFYAPRVLVCVQQRRYTYRMDFLPFFVVLMVSVLFSSAFRRFHLPWVLALIVAGVVIGPYGLGFGEVTPTIAFMGEIGLIFLMFMAGLETKLSSFKEFGAGIVRIASLNGLVPFVVGVIIGTLFGLPVVSAILMGIIFMSSSVAVIIPALEETGLIEKRVGRSIIASTIIVDVASLILLSVLLQTTNPVTALPLPSFYVLLAVILAAFGYGLPRLRNLIPHPRKEADLFESEVRIIFAMLLGTVVTFGLLGLHPIIAGFFTGLVMSDSIRSEIMIEKLRTISYGIFIPVFFVVVGFQTDVSALIAGASALSLAVVLVLGAMGSKYVSGYIAARWSGFTTRESQLVGIATTPQLSTTLAVVFTGVELGLLQSDLIASMVLLSVVSTVVAPLALRRIKIGWIG